MIKNMRGKVLGMLIGGAIGDALGAPVETWSPEKIKEVHGGQITGYVPAIGHKWFKEDTFPVGSTTDDTQLMLATARGLTAGHSDSPTLEAYMDAIAAEHCKSMGKSTAGWGGSTKEAIRRLQNGVHWSESGKSTNPMRGTGNGVPMKIAPLAIVQRHLGVGAMLGDKSWPDLCVAYSAMTHYSKMSAYAAVMHAETCSSCLPYNFVSNRYFYELWANGIFDWPNRGERGFRYDVSYLNDTEDDLQKTMQDLAQAWKDGDQHIEIEKRRELFGNGSCYVYHSLPFTYSFFLHVDEFPLDALLEVVNAGGDTDTNAAMLGNLIGGMYGIALFEQEENRWVLDDLQGLDEIIDVATDLCIQFGIE